MASDVTNTFRSKMAAQPNEVPNYAANGAQPGFFFPSELALGVKQESKYSIGLLLCSFFLFQRPIVLLYYELFLFNAHFYL